MSNRDFLCWINYRVYKMWETFNLLTIKERLIWCYLSLFPKYTNPVKWRDFFLCNSSESLLLKTILHSLHINFVSDLAALSFLKEGILICPNIQFLVLKVDLTLLIKILFKFYFKCSSGRSFFSQHNHHYI